MHSSAVEHGIADPMVASSILAAPFTTVLIFFVSVDWGYSLRGFYNFHFVSSLWRNW